MKNNFRVYVVVCVLISLTNFTNAQNTVGDRNAGGVDVNTQPGGIVQEIDKVDSKTIGSIYLNEEWIKGSIVLSGGNTINNQLLRYDIENGIIEIFKTENDIKVINETFISSVRIVSNKAIKDDLFLNGKQFNLNYVPLTGLVLSEQIEGKYNLITRFSVKRSDSYYVKALDAGKEDYIISVEKKHYLAINENLTEIPKGKKNVIALFSMDVDISVIKAYILDNALNIKKYTDLVFLVNYVNNQVE